MLEKLRLVIRKWLGLDVLPTYEHLNAISQQMHEKQTETLARLERLELLLGRPQITRSVNVTSAADWETVQIAMMQALQSTEKEN